MSDRFDKKLERYYKFIPKTYKPGVNPFVTALLRAFAQGDAEVELQIEEGGKQIFVETAENKYLDALAANVGVTRPLSINLSDDSFRRLIPILSYKPKQIRKTMYELLDVFWGPLYSRANITSHAKEPYNLGAILPLTGTLNFQGQNQVVTGVGTLFTIELSIGTYIKYFNHNNEYFGRVSRIESNTKLYLDNLYTGGSLGSSFTGQGVKYNALTLEVNIDSKGIQTVFIPPHLISDTTAVTAEEVANSINSQMSTSNTSGTLTASVIIDYINDWSYVNLRSDSPGTIGSIEVSDGTANIYASGVQNFSGNSVFVSNEEAVDFNVLDNVIVGSDDGFIATSIISITPDSPVAGTSTIVVADNVDIYIQRDHNFIYQQGLLGFSNREQLISNLTQRVSLYEINSKELIVNIPVTVPALRRQLEGSIHPRSNWSGEITAVDNVLKQVTVNFDLDAVQLNYFEGKTFSSQLNEFTIVSNQAGQTGVIIQLDTSADISGLSTLTGFNGFVILASNYQGSFVFDPQNSSFTATMQRCVLNQVISKGLVFPSISVINGEDIPNESGYLILDFGKNNQEQPVRYRGRPNNNTLLLDPSYIFQKNHTSGEMLNVLVSTLSGTVPRVDGRDFAAYITGIEEARLVVQDLLEQMKAAGVTITFVITAPEYLWHTGRPEEV